MKVGDIFARQISTDHFGMLVTLYDIKNLKKRFKDIPDPPSLSQNEMFSHVNFHLQTLEELAMSAGNMDRFWMRLDDMAALTEKWKVEENPSANKTTLLHNDRPPTFECTEVTSPSVMHFKEEEDEEMDQETNKVDIQVVDDDIPSSSTTYYPKMQPPPTCSSSASLESPLVVYRDELLVKQNSLSQLNRSKRPGISQLARFLGSWSLVPSSMKSDQL